MSATLRDDSVAERPVVPGEIIGWRAWEVFVTPSRVALRSLYFDVEWPTDRWLEAECACGSPRCSEVPGEGGCGICAARDRDHLASLHRYGDPNCKRYVDEAKVTAIGQVGLCGLVYPATRGWRAQKARVVRLWLPYEYWRLCERLSAAYNVPVGLENTLRRGESDGHRT